MERGYVKILVLEKHLEEVEMAYNQEVFFVKQSSAVETVRSARCENISIVEKEV
jgi:hypothetical protein